MYHELLERYLFEKRIDKLEKLINEAKQVGTLYHVCTLKSYNSYIRETDTLSSSGHYKNHLHNEDRSYISFTRDKHFDVKTNEAQMADVLVQLVIDGDLLSENYKIGPYNDFAFTSKGKLTKSSDNPKYREKEEVVKGPIKNISKYIKEINVFPTDITSSMTYTALNKSELAESGAKYFNFCNTKHNNKFTRYMKSYNIIDGTPFSEVMPIIKNYIDQNKIKDLLFSGKIKSIKEAIKKGADINANYDGDNLIRYYCTSDSNYNIVNLLIENDADLDVKSCRGDTPIILAVKNKCYTIVKLLAENEADLEIEDANGKTPLDIAHELKNSEMVSLLTNLGAKK